MKILKLLMMTMMPWNLLDDDVSDAEVSDDEVDRMMNLNSCE